MQKPENDQPKTIRYEIFLFGLSIKSASIETKGGQEREIIFLEGKDCSLTKKT